MIDHVGLEVSDLARSARFYDALFFPLGWRRTYENEGIVGYGLEQSLLFLTARTEPRPGFGHLALRASGRVAVDAAYEAGMANGGSDAGPPGDRPQYGPRYYAAFLYDPDGLKVEIVTGR